MSTDQSAPYAWAIIESLERAAQICDDPTPLVYQNLFSSHPEMEELFMLDRNNEAKGHMLFEVLECILDFVGPRYTSEGLILTERLNHEQIGVPIEIFGSFFVAIRDTFKELLGKEWSPDYEQAWDKLLEELAEIIHGATRSE